MLYGVELAWNSSSTGSTNGGLRPQTQHPSPFGASCKGTAPPPARPHSSQTAAGARCPYSITAAKATAQASEHASMIVHTNTSRSTPPLLFTCCCTKHIHMRTGFHVRARTRVRMHSEQSRRSPGAAWRPGPATYSCSLTVSLPCSTIPGRCSGR